MKRRSLLRGGGAAALLRAIGAAAETPTERRTVTVGLQPGPHVELFDAVQRIAEPRGLALRADVRDGGRGINADVAAGRLDVACFQNAVAFADACAADRRHLHDALVNIAPTVTQPIAIYARRLAALRQLGDGATVGIPREPPAAARALILLQNHGLLTLRDGAGLHAGLDDVVATRRHLRLVALPHDRLAGALDRLDCAVIDSPHAMQAGWQPARDSIGLEDARTPYADVLVVRRSDRAQPWVATLVACYHADEIKRFILARFQDAVRRPW